MKDILIEIKDLSKFFENGTFALRNVNLHIRQGDIYGIIGLSGAGKSTLMRCLTALERPSSGSISLFTQKNEKDLETIRKQIGMVFQHFHLFSSRTVAQNIAYPMEIHGIPKAERQQKVEELLSLVGLSNKHDAYPSQLSGGEKQRVGIARALANNPKLLLCDEPTSALDPQTTRSLLQLLLRLNQTLGLTIVMITHQLDVVKQICNKVAVLSQGEIVEEGEVKDVFIHPTHPVTRHLLHLDVDQIPEELITQRDPNKKLVRLGFKGNQAKEPILSQMIKRYAIEANILSGGLDYLQQTIIGHLIVELSGPSNELQEALAFLHSQQVNCEVIL